MKDQHTQDRQGAQAIHIRAVTIEMRLRMALRCAGVHEVGHGGSSAALLQAFDMGLQRQAGNGPDGRGHVVISHG